MKKIENKGKEERVVVLTVNQRVVGSSPTGGAGRPVISGFFLCFISTFYIHLLPINIISVILIMLIVG